MPKSKGALQNRALKRIIYGTLSKHASTCQGRTTRRSSPDVDDPSGYAPQQKKSCVPPGLACIRHATKLRHSGTAPYGEPQGLPQATPALPVSCKTLRGCTSSTGAYGRPSCVHEEYRYVWTPLVPPSTKSNTPLTAGAHGCCRHTRIFRPAK